MVWQSSAEFPQIILLGSPNGSLDPLIHLGGDSRDNLEKNFLPKEKTKSI